MIIVENTTDKIRTAAIEFAFGAKESKSITYAQFAKMVTQIEKQSTTNNVLSFNEVYRKLSRQLKAAEKADDDDKVTLIEDMLVAVRLQQKITTQMRENQIPIGDAVDFSVPSRDDLLESAKISIKKQADFSADMKRPSLELAIKEYLLQTTPDEDLAFLNDKAKFIRDGVVEKLKEAGLADAPLNSKKVYVKEHMDRGWGLGGDTLVALLDRAQQFTDMRNTAAAEYAAQTPEVNTTTTENTQTTNVETVKSKPAQTPPSADTSLLASVSVLKKRESFHENPDADAVKVMQEALIAAGYKLPKFGADGKYGPETAFAAAQYQQDHGIKGDGTVIDKTMIAALTKKSSKAVDTQDAVAKIDDKTKDAAKKATVNLKPFSFETPDPFNLSPNLPWTALQKEKTQKA